MEEEEGGERKWPKGGKEPSIEKQHSVEKTRVVYFASVCLEIRRRLAKKRSGKAFKFYGFLFLLLLSPLSQTRAQNLHFLLLLFFFFFFLELQPQHKNYTGTGSEETAWGGGAKVAGSRGRGEETSFPFFSINGERKRREIEREREERTAFSSSLPSRNAKATQKGKKHSTTCLLFVPFLFPFLLPCIVDSLTS